MNDDWAVEEVLSGLSAVTPDAARATRVREMCQGKLARPGVRARNGGRAPFMRKLESAAVSGFCAVYISLLALIALRAHGLL